MIKKCLFPAAGYGTRFLPATKSIPKEMLPIVNKPLIHYGIEEARRAGINEFGFVTGRSKKAIEDYLDYAPEIETSIKGSIITIQGEVKIPGAQTYVKDYTIENYINSVGGFNDRADKEHILIIKQNGQVITYNIDEFFKKSVTISPGDSILVLGKPNSESLQITKDITQILYQIAVSAGVVLRLF